MTDVIEIDEFDANWIKEVAGTVPPTVGTVATVLDPDIWAYSPNQPRKPDGKFGTGGGGYVQPKPTSRHPVLDESADRAGIGVDDLVHRRFDEEHAKGLASAIDRVDKAFPGSLKGSLLFTDEQAVLDSQFGKGTAAATSMNGKKILDSDSANNVPAMYQPDGNHSHSAGGDTTEGVLTHELNHVALDLGGARYLSATAKGDAYDLAKTLPVPTKYAEGDRGDGRERAAELLTQAEFGQPSADAAGYFATVKDSYAKSPKRHTSATALDPDVWAYSPNQPRKSDGKFGTGGGLKGGSSESTDNGGPGAAGITVAGLKGTAAIADHFASESPQAHPTWEQKKATGKRLKAESMAQVGADLDAQFPADRLTQAADAIGSSKFGKTPGEKVADVIQDTWATQSFDDAEWASTSVQLAVAREFKTPVTRDISGPIRADGDTVANWPSTHGFDMPVMQAAVRSMHTHTQERLDALGVGPTVALVRGTGTTHRGQTDITMHPASSWTTDTHVADSFAGGSDSGDGSRLSMTVPNTWILSMPGHGIGCYEESEVVVMGGSGDQASAVRPEGLMR